MKKTLQILLGFLLILVLAYFSFLEVSTKIQEDLDAKVKTKFTDKGIVGIHAKVKGEGLGLTRTIVLTGTTASENEKRRIAALIEELDGVGSVKNEIVVKAREYSVSIVPKSPIVKKVNVSVPVAKVAVVPEKVVEKEELNAIEAKSTVSVVPSVPMVTVLKGPAPAKPDANKTVPETHLIKIPTVPVVTQKFVEVPKAIEVITVPVPVEVEEAVVPEEVTKNIKTQGVE